MEFQKITTFFDKNSDNKDLPKLVTNKWTEVCDQSQINYDVNKEIRIKTSMLISDLSHFNDAYIVIKGNILVIKKRFIAADFERPNNTNLKSTNTNNANNIAFAEKKFVF